jgi:hypothetical protein
VWRVLRKRLQAIHRSTHGMVGRLVNNELEDLKGSERDLIEVSSRYFPEETGISMKIVVSRPRLELNTSKKKKSLHNSLTKNVGVLSGGRMQHGNSIFIRTHQHYCRVETAPFTDFE